MTEKQKSSLDFRLMALTYRFRDWLHPPEETLAEVGIEPGYRVLEYGCGPGGFSVAAARMVGRSGKVHALDIHPVAIRAVQKAASKQGLTNIQTIHSSCATGLEAETIDVILLLDTFHALDDPDGVLRESCIVC